MRALVLQAPAGYAKTLGALPEGVTLNGKRPLDFIQFFTRRKGDLVARFGALAGSLAPEGMLWISWPKQSAKVETDLNEDVIRAVGLKHGLVDVKVCAVDEVWSGLKFVRRLKDRA
jgi:hypothetical protein